MILEAFLQSIKRDKPAEALSLVESYLNERASEVIAEARFVRKNFIRKGKVLRRHKVATRKGFTMRSGKVTRMSPQERRRRKLSQRKGARKRKAKVSRTLRKRKISLRRRARLVGKGK